jgi:DNA-binding transcriptional MerR regulator
MYNIETLSKLTGLSRRSIRYYIQRELLPPPEGSGRGAYYTDEHLKRLHRIKQWSEQGVPLFQMKAMLKKNTDFDLETIPQQFHTEKPQIYHRILLDNGLELHAAPGKLSDEAISQIKKSVHLILKKESS